MCSINGVYSLKKNLSKEAIFNAEQIQNQLKYRGPDHSDKFVNPTCALYSNIFSIVDRTNKSNPFYSDDKKIVLIFNGEIYNYKELRSILQNKGYIFSTKSDTEVVMHSYKEYGESCFAKFKGMFAIAIFDQRETGKEKLLLARDKFGEKPLFYFKKNSQLYFSSESLPLVNLTDKKINTNSLAEFFSLGFSLNHIIEGIKRLQPGSYLSITGKKFKVKKYWIPEFYVDYNISEKTAILEYTNIISRIIKEMYPQEVNVGVFLSGGIDSTLISLALYNYKKNVCCISSGLINTKKQYFNFFNTEKSGNEFKKVEKIVRSLKINLNKKEFTTEKFIENFNNLVLHLPGGPTMSTSFPLWFFAADEAKKLGKRTVFAGEGADELFCGYKTNNPALYLNSEHKLVEKYSEIMGLCNYKELKLLLKNKFDNPFKKLQSNLDKEFKGNGKPEDILMNKLRYMLGPGLVICPQMLEKADGMTMSYPLEVRLPYLHSDSVEYVYKLPSKFIINNQQKKILLRKVAKEIGVPNFVIEEPKQRTSLPYYKLFFKSKYANYFQKKILRKNALIKEILNSDFVDKIVLDDKNPGKLLSLLILESYLESIFKNKQL